jgi:fluoride ion exporter CrcB/FEX
MVTGNPGFAATYALSQSLPADTVSEPTSSRWIWLLLALLLGILIGLLICWLGRKKARL